MIYNNSWKKIPEDQKFVQPPEGIRQLQKGFYAYHTHPDFIYPIIERLFSNREICELNEVHLSFVDTGIAIRYNGSFTELWRVGFSNAKK